MFPFCRKSQVYACAQNEFLLNERNGKFIGILRHLSDEPNPPQLLCLPNETNKQTKKGTFIEKLLERDEKKTKKQKPLKQRETK